MGIGIGQIIIIVLIFILIFGDVQKLLKNFGVRYLDSNTSKKKGGDS
jgi:Sec-independent protein translocase protein TatA